MQYNQNNDKKDEKKGGDNSMQTKPTSTPSSHSASHDTKAVESDKAMMDKKAEAPESK